LLRFRGGKSPFILDGGKHLSLSQFLRRRHNQP
jgi:hypothetical protein